MKKIKIKAPAKINLTLDILGQEKGYHDIKSLVTTINLYDKIILKKRKDKRINVELKGLDVGCSMFDNNAYKAGKMFVETFSTNGADIFIEKNIPIGAGLGGSSADIAGVLNGMKELYQTTDNLLPLANNLGSDSGYMLSGGYAVITGRGEKIAKKEIPQVLYLLLITENKQISARASYKAFDKLEKTYKPCTTSAEKALKEKDFEKFCSCIKNDLYLASSQIVEEIKLNVQILKKIGAPAQIMTGSGSAVCGIYFNKRERNKAYKKLYPIYKNQLIKANTI